MTARPVARLRVDGAAKLRRTLKAAGRDLEGQALKDAHKKAADLVAREARPDTPVGPDTGGHIKEDIRTSGTASAAIIRAGRARRPYAGPVHWGWRARGIKAQPWIYEAAQRTTVAWTGIYLTAVEEVLDTIEGTAP